MAKQNIQVSYARRTRLGRAVSTGVAVVVLTVVGLGATSASADPYTEPCDDPIGLSMPCTTH